MFWCFWFWNVHQLFRVFGLHMHIHIFSMAINYRCHHDSGRPFGWSVGEPIYSGFLNDAHYVGLKIVFKTRLPIMLDPVGLGLILRFHHNYFGSYPIKRLVKSFAIARVWTVNILSTSLPWYGLFVHIPLRLRMMFSCQKKPRDPSCCTDGLGVGLWG